MNIDVLFIYPIYFIIKIILQILFQEIKFLFQAGVEPSFLLYVQMFYPVEYLVKREKTQGHNFSNLLSFVYLLRRIFGPKRDENGEWRRLHNEEPRSLYRSPNIVRVIKSRRLRWAGHVA